jgi:phosphatidylglycerophosphatase A
MIIYLNQNFLNFRIRSIEKAILINNFNSKIKV